MAPLYPRCPYSYRRMTKSGTTYYGTSLRVINVPWARRTAVPGATLVGVLNRGGGVPKLRIFPEKFGRHTAYMHGSFQLAS